MSNWDFRKERRHLVLGLLSFRYIRLWWTVGFVALVVLTAPAQLGTTARVSVSSTWQQGNGVTRSPSISADGRYVAFWSNAANLVPSDNNGYADVFVRDRQTGQTELVSVSSSGIEANGDCFLPSISADGRYVAFESSASNLVLADINATVDVFIHDRQTGLTAIVSVSSTGQQGNGNSSIPEISANGRYVAYQSSASNLAPGDANGAVDVFVHDCDAGETTRVSISSSDQQGNGDSYRPSISGDGRYVAFSSLASNLVLDDTNGTVDVFVHDRLTKTTERVSVSSIGQQATADCHFSSISTDGRYVAFHSNASNLVPGDTDGLDVFIRDRETSTTERVSDTYSGEPSNGGSYFAAISGDGRFVAFTSSASNLVPWDTHHISNVFVRDRLAGQTSLVSVSSSGLLGNCGSDNSAISLDGRFVGFDGCNTNLVAEDTNDAEDVFVHQIDSGPGWGDAEVNLAGQLKPDSYSGAMPASLMFEFRNQGETTPFDTRTATIAPDGTYTVTAYARQMDASVKTLSWLRRTIPTDARSGSVSGLDMTFDIGDANENNSVDLFDLNAVFTAYGDSGGPADVQGDGVVDLRDLNIIFLNFGLFGDP